MNKDAKVEKSRLNLEYCRQISLIVVIIPVGNRTYFIK